LNVWFTFRFFLGGRHDHFLIKVLSLKLHSGRKLDCSNILLIWNVNGCFDSGFEIITREKHATLATATQLSSNGVEFG
jgi:hypothetical protein